MLSIQKHPSPILRSSVFSLLPLLLLASCSSGGTRDTVDATEETVAEVPLPAEMQLAELNGSAINLANRVTAYGDMYYTLLDSTGSAYTLYRFNIITKEQQRLAELSAWSERRGRANSVRAILDVVVNEDKVMLFSELQYRGVDGDTKSDYNVDVLDMATGALVKEGEMWMGGAPVSQNRSPWAGWLTYDGTPVVYLTFLASKSSVPLPLMTAAVGHDRYEFVVKREIDDWQLAKAHAGGDSYRLMIYCLPYDTMASASLEWKRGGRQLRKVYDAPLTGLVDYDWHEYPELTQVPQYTWAGSYNAIQQGDKLYFLLNDVLLALRNGQVERVASLELSKHRKVDGNYFPRFIAPEGYRTDRIWGVGRDRSGLEGCLYRKLYSIGSKLFVGVDARRLYEYDMNSAQGRFISLDTTACLGCEPSEFFIGEGTIWQLQTNQQGKSLVRFDRGGNLINRYPVHFDGYEVTEGPAQVLALEDRATKTVRLYLMHPVTPDELSVYEYGFDPVEEPEWRDDEAAGDSTLVPVDTVEP